MDIIDVETEDEELPAFALTVMDDGEGDIEILAHYTQTPSESEQAPLGLMYGLAVLMLDREGAMQDIIDGLLKHGPMSELDCVAAISLLMQQDPDDLPN